jgi:hypothetical protein
MTWPVAELDAIGRLRALASAYPSAGIAEVALDVPFDEAWAWVTDFENNVPRLDTMVRKVRVRRLGDGRLRMLAWLRWSPLPWPFRVRVERGFCVMQARAKAFLVVMAAVPDDRGMTRYAHAEAVPIRRLGVLRRLYQRMVEADLARLRSNLRPRA